MDARPHKFYTDARNAFAAVTLLNDTGRAPYAPQLMVGLILYGVMQGVHSLRKLERLARLDLGCLWVTGGIAPDHANIGRFIVLHEAVLTRPPVAEPTKRCSDHRQQTALLRAKPARCLRITSSLWEGSWYQSRYCTLVAVRFTAERTAFARSCALPCPQ